MTTRRVALQAGLGGVLGLAIAAAAGFDLVDHGVLPGKTLLDRVDGACEVPAPPMRFAARIGPSFDGTFYSAARQRVVGYSIAYPPGHGPGSDLPLIVGLHAYGADHRGVLHTSLARALALVIDGAALPPMAIASADGGGLYWNPHPGDDPLGMVVNELIPRCQARGLGRPPHRIGTVGISMGGYGAILVAEKYPQLISAIAAIGPAIWTSYAQARSVNKGAYASAAAFASADAVTHASALRGVAVRVASGLDDPFHPGVEALVQALPPGATVDISHGCHTTPFFAAQEAPSMAFLAQHLTAR